MQASTKAASFCEMWPFRQSPKILTCKSLCLMSESTRRWYVHSFIRCQINQEINTAANVQAIASRALTYPPPCLSARSIRRRRRRTGDFALVCVSGAANVLAGSIRYAPASPPATARVLRISERGGRRVHLRVWQCGVANYVH